jgi:septal ring factor EnvC (AmiA/AmiB activator)
MPFDDDLDLDALMLRVRDAAMAGTPGSRPVQPQASSEGDAGELDVIRVLEAQGDWNEQARQDVVALLDSIRTLRDDWNEVHAGLRREIAQLSAQVDELRAAALAPATRTRVSGNTRARTRREPTAPRRSSKRRSAGGRKPRS